MCKNLNVLSSLSSSITISYIIKLMKNESKMYFWGMSFSTVASCNSTTLSRFSQNDFTIVEVISN